MHLSAALLVLSGCWLLVKGAEAKKNVTELPTKERFRRLIPYITYYWDPQQYQYQQSRYQLVPVGYLVGGGYNQVPVYSSPDYSTPVTYTPQNPTDLSRIIKQNYLSIAKQMSDLHKPLTGRLAQPTVFDQGKNTKQQQLRYATDQNKRPSQKSYLHAYQQSKNIQSRPRVYRPQYAVPKADGSFVQIQSNFEPNYEATQNTKSYEPDPDVLTITKSQELSFLPEDYRSAPTSLPPAERDYEESLPNLNTNNHNSLVDLLPEYPFKNGLPQKQVSSSNLGLSTQSLSSILESLKKVKTHPDYVLSSVDIDDDGLDNIKQTYSPYQTEGSTPGRAGIDYPAFNEIPHTQFDCKKQRYKGFFGDPETSCQVWHYCDLNGGKASFLCPNGTIFSQVALTCDWWFNVKCASTAQLYVLNERLYKYILPHKPSFPEDFAGPLVDQYLEEKFQELEAKKNTTSEKPPSTIQILLNDEINQAVK